MKHRSLIALGCLLAMILGSLPACAQPSNKIREKVVDIGISNKITVVFKNGTENYGAVSNIGTDTFEIVEIDLRQKLLIRYDEVKKVRSNYGGQGFMGKRPNPLWGIIAGAALLGTLLALAVVVGGS